MSGGGYRHEAFFYRSDVEFVRRMAEFIARGVHNDAAVLVALPARQTAMVRAALGGGAERVQFAPMEVLGRNPAWLIPVWSDFVAANPGRPLCGIGEPAFVGRSDEELAECDRHESLLNVAFPHSLDFELLCPYDERSLPAPVLEAAQRNHPRLGGTDRHQAFAADAWQRPQPWPARPSGTPSVAFDLSSLAAARRHAGIAARTAGVASTRIPNVELAVGEAAANSVRHGGGNGSLACWSSGDTFICEISDRGRISDPLAGRVRPAVDRPGGRGLWLMHQLSDLTRLRVGGGEGEQRIRLHFST